MEVESAGPDAIELIYDKNGVTLSFLQRGPQLGDPTGMVEDTHDWMVGF